MSIEVISESESGIQFKIRGDFTIYEVAAVRDEAASFFERFSDVTVDLSEVDNFDSSAFQLLSFWKIEGARNGRKVSYVKHSKQILHYLDVYGVLGLFADKIVLPKGERSEYNFKYGIKRQKFNL